MKKTTFLTLSLLCSLLLTQCSWPFGKKDADPISQLPPATQEGKNTFGCVVNGQAWVPKTSLLTSPGPLTWEYLDSFGRNGYFNVSARRKVDGVDQGMTIAIGDGLSSQGVYSLMIQRQIPYFFDVVTLCEYGLDSTDVPLSGTLTITKLDKTNRIIAGSFEFTFAKSDCDTIRVTEGRFDLRY